MGDSGHLLNDPLSKGLTRPAMVLGVSFTFCGINLVVSMLVYILSKNLLVVLLMIPLIHGVGYVICFTEPLFMELFMIKSKKCNRCRNKFYHGGNSYDIT